MEALESRCLLAADLVLDFNTQSMAEGSAPSNLVFIGNTAYFSANVDGLGIELWKSDGTASGTMLVKDIRVGSVGSAPSFLTNVNGTLFFRASDGLNGTELWKSDGTAAGTVMVKDIQDGSTGSNPASLIEVNGMLYFNVNKFSTLRELWKSDGTAAGTTLVRNIGDESIGPAYFTNVNGSLFFRATASSNASDSELWMSDGTTAGTTLVKDIQPGVTGSNPLQFTNVNGLLFFTATTVANGNELWKSDGSAAGTIMVKDIAVTNSSSPDNLTNVNGVLYFSARDSGFNQELWTSDGTSAGTTMIKDIIIGANGSNPGQFLNANGVLYFTADDGNTGRELWKSNGTAAGTVMVKELTVGLSSPPISGLTALSSLVFFYANDGASGLELWKSDGTAVGTVMVKDIYTGPLGSSPNPAALWSNSDKLFFRATDGNVGMELWKSDGTAAGTMLIKDIRPATDNSDHLQATSVNGTLLVSSTSDLVRSDGTAAGTFRLAGGSQSQYLTEVSGVTYFRSSSGGLWKTDGSLTGTSNVRSQTSFNPMELTNVSGTLMFAARDAANGLELWKSNGTSASTVLVKNITSNNGDSSPRELTNVDGTLYFSATNSSGTSLDSGFELWTSDGTAAGTVMIKDILAGATGSTPLNLTNVDGTLYFTANDGTSGIELWKSNGTADGTLMVKDIFSGPGSSNPTQLTNVDGVLYFTATDSTNGLELWKSDGTAAGTQLVKNIGLGSTGSDPKSLVDIDGTLFFVATDGFNGTEIWRSNGTAADTVLVKDIFPGVTSSSPAELTNVAGWLVFRANDGVSGQELWVSDGSLSGTKLLDEVNLGSAGSDPMLVVPIGSQILFSAVGTQVGRELWSIAGPGLGTRIVDSNLFMDVDQLTNSADVSFNLAADDLAVVSTASNTKLFDPDRYSIERVRGVEIQGAQDTAEHLTIDHSSGLIDLPQGIRFGGLEGGQDTLSVVALSNMDVTLTQTSTSLIVDSYTQSGGIEIDFAGVKQVNINGARRIATSGFVELDFPLSVTHQLPLELGSVTLLSGTTLTSSGTVALGAGKSLVGSGSVAGRIAGESGSLIQANGNLLLGNSSSAAGFQSRGELETGVSTVTLLDSNQAVMGALTTLGNATQPGTLVAANGALVDFGNNLIGFGSVQTPNNSTKVLMINGSAEGKSLSQPLTLTGFVKGVGSLNNVAVTGTYSPGLSPAAVSLGNVIYAPSATTLVELAGTVPGSGHDQLNHTGQAVLNGKLKVELLGGFQPALGNTFTIMTAETLSGAFAEVQLPALTEGLQWRSNYGSHSLTLEIIATNAIPTDVSLSNAFISENRSPASLVGVFSTTDPNAGDSFTYTLVNGAGDTGNGLFTILGNELRTNSALNYEQQTSHSIRVRTVDSGGLAFEKPLIINVRDLPEFTGIPIIGTGAIQRSVVNQVSLAVDGIVEIVSGAFAMVKRGSNGGPVALQSSMAQVGNQTVVTLTFSGDYTRNSQGALVDGYYELTVDGTKITRSGIGLDVNSDGIGGDTFKFGDDEADAFFALYGDTDGDGLVGVSEFGQFRSTFGKAPTDSGYNALFDFDGFGIGVADFGQFRNRFGKAKMPWN